MTRGDAGGGRERAGRRDAVALAAPAGPATPLRCPFCLHGAPLRDFLTLGEPTRPARVEVRLVLPAAPVR